MSMHEQFAEDLALYALDALTGDERAALEKHLEGCPGCRLELEQLRGDAALLALSVSGAHPPQRARQRLLDAVAREASSSPAAKALPKHVWLSALRNSWWGVLGWTVAAALLVLALSLRKDNAALSQNVALIRQHWVRSSKDLEELRRVVAPILSPSAQRVTLVSTGMKTPPPPQGKAFYLRGRGNLVFLASNLPSLPPLKAYELWLIPTAGAPIPAGMFKPDARGSASVINPPLTSGTEAKAFAITIEPEAGSTTPTLPIVMMGAGE
jgi:anti-sigma-K factor RskA